MVRPLLLFISVLVVPIPSSAREPEAVDDAGRTSVKVEVRARLRVTGKFRKIPFWDAPTNPGSHPLSGIEDPPATGASIETRPLGVVEVYFGDDEGLRKSAEKLDGEIVIVSGYLDRFSYYSAKQLLPVEMSLWNAQTKRTLMMPSQVTRTFIRARRIEAAR